MLKIIMRNSTVDGNGTGWEFEAVDHVEEEKLDSYLLDARTRWTHIEVVR